MRLHDRYLLRELLTPLAICLGGFMVFWIPIFFFTELEHMQESKLSGSECLQYFLVTTPGFLILVLPLVFLLSLLYALTHHARFNEITALRAAGVGLWRLCAPYFLVGLVMAGVYFALNELVVPRCNDRADRLLTRHLQNDNNLHSKTHFTKSGFRNTRANRVWQVEVGEFDLKTETMSHPVVSWNHTNGTWSVLMADAAFYTNESWTFNGVQMFDQTEVRGILRKLYVTNVLVLTNFNEVPQKIARDLRFSDENDMLKSHSADIPISELWPYLNDNPDLPAKEQAQLLTKLYGRLAAPWTCLVVVFIAIPFGAAPGRRNLFFGVAGSIFICFAFFILQIVGLSLGMNGYLPAWLAASLPNIFFLTLGVVLTSRIR